MSYLPPIEIDPATQGIQPGTTGIYGGNVCTGPFLCSGNLYIILVGTDNKLHSMKSTNSGATWAEADAAHAPSIRVYQSIFDGNHLITIAYKFGTPLGAPFDLRMIQFDCSTDLWGSAQTGGPNTNQVEQILYRSATSDYLIFYYTNSNSGQNAVTWNGSFGAGFRIDTNFTSSAHYQGSLAGLRACLDPNNNCHVFFVASQSVPVSGSAFVCYQQVSSSGVLGSFFQWTQFDGSSWNSYDLAGLPVATANCIVLPFCYSNVGAGQLPSIPSIIVGAPINAPVWTELQTPTGIDPGFDPSLIEAYPGMGSELIGGTLYITYGDTTFQRVRICQTSNLVNPTLGWSAEDAFFDNTGISAIDSSSTLPVIIAGSPQVCFNNLDTGGSGNKVRFFTPFGGVSTLAASCNNPPVANSNTPYSHSFTASGGTAPYSFAISSGTLPAGLVMDASGNVTGTPWMPVGATYPIIVTVTDSTLTTASVSCAITVNPPPYIGQSITGGLPGAVSYAAALLAGLVPGGQILGNCRPKNEYDECLVRLEKLWKHAKIPSPYKPCIGIDTSTVPWEPDYGALPPGSEPFRRVGSIVTPTPGDTLVVSLLVPNGYDGILTGLFQFYSGSGFFQGAGDILWRVKANLRYIWNFGAVPFALGLPTFPMPLTEGELLLSDQVLSYIVNVPNLSGNIQVGGSRIVCGFFGFFWPRGAAFEVSPQGKYDTRTPKTVRPAR